MAALPIGGYDPDWKFGYGNVTPEEAVQIHQDVLAMCSLALSWGTFTVSNEVCISDFVLRDLSLHLQATHCLHVTVR